MLFNELIEQEGLESVISKTNISKVNLNYLLNEEFEKLNRVKALGFLLILEREYSDIDVDELRERIKLYYDDHKPHDDKVVMVPKDSTTGGGFSFFKLFIILAILGGGYYLYQAGKLNSLVQNIEDKKEFFDDNKALENNVSTEDAKKVVVKTADENSIEIVTPTTKKEQTTTSNNSQPNLIATTKTAQSSATQMQTAMTNVAPEKNQTVAQVVQEVSEEFLANEANSTTSEEQLTANTTPISTITVNPTRGILWFGFINLDTKKRREFMTKVSTPFQIKDGKWLLVTGHGFFNIVSDAKSVELADNKKHYFYIDSTDIREIDKKEFRKLNGNRGW